MRLLQEFLKELNEFIFMNRIKKKERNKLFLSLIFAIVLSISCNTQQKAVTHVLHSPTEVAKETELHTTCSFSFLEKQGIICEYTIGITIKHTETNQTIDDICTLSRKTTRHLLGKHELYDLITKGDSIETAITSAIKNEASQQNYPILSVSIEELRIPKSIYEFLKENKTDLHKISPREE